jgi:hypothetical protein
VDGDDLAARIVAERGYLVLVSTTPLRIGQLTDSSGHCEAPLIVVGPATADDYYAQGKLAADLSGDASKAVHPKSLKLYFYKVNAAD